MSNADPAPIPAVVVSSNPGSEVPDVFGPFAEWDEARKRAARLRDRGLVAVVRPLWNP